MSKHTPGPWSVKETVSATLLIRPNSQQDSLQIDSRADARLIAAAPELLAALHAVVNLPGFEPDEPYGVQVLAAIAKAEEQKP